MSEEARTKVSTAGFPYNNRGPNSFRPHSYPSHMIDRTKTGGTKTDRTNVSTNRALLIYGC